MYDDDDDVEEHRPFKEKSGMSFVLWTNMVMVVMVVVLMVMVVMVMVLMVMVLMVMVMVMVVLNALFFAAKAVLSNCKAS